MKRLQFYVCPDCGNLLMAMDEAQISCCGKKLTPQPLQKADEAHALTVEPVEQEWFLTTSHPMRREHYIAFAAFLSGDTLVLRKRYPEWGLDTRLPMLGHGLLLWYCTRHGLFYQTV